MNYAIEAEGLSKRFGTTQALSSRRPARPRGHRARPARPQRRRQDHRRAHPRDAAAGRRRHRPRRRTRRRQGRRRKVRQTIGLTGQYASVDEDLTGTQNLVLIGQLLNLSTGDAKARAAELLEWFDLTDAAGRMAKTYSGGMRRRLDLAASLVGRPSVIFLDEPTTGLDPAKREDMWDVVRRLVVRRIDRPAHDPVPRRGRRARRRDHRHRPRPGHRQRHPGRPQARRRRPAHRRQAGRPGPPGRRARHPARGLRQGGRSAAAGPAHRAGQRARTRCRPRSPRLGAAGIAVTELSLHLPSLDEVFMTLTGKPTDRLRQRRWPHEHGNPQHTDPAARCPSPTDVSSRNATLQWFRHAFVLAKRSLIKT